MAEKKDSEKVRQMVQAVGATAEMALVFYRAAVESDATPAEAIRLTQAYLGALLFGNQQRQPPENEEE